MQGNGAAPAGWAVVSISIIHAHKKDGHGATFLCPITNYKHRACGILYVDDTDLIHLNLEEDESVEEAHASLQQAIWSWSDLLIASGGSLKPEKCFYHLISFSWDRKGNFHYENNHDNPEYDITVNLPNGTQAPIDHLPVDEASVTLGVSSCPSGVASSSLELVKEKALKWANQSRNSHLPPRDMHFGVHRKFWPKVKYGLCANTASFDELVGAMHKPYHLMCSVGGVVQSAKREIRYLDDGFYGVGFPHWGIEAIVESVNKLMTHVGTKTMVGSQYQMSFELFIIELGLTDQPFLLDHPKYGKWVTPTILSETWARMHRFGFKLSVDTAKMKMPREGDRWFMRAVEEAGFSAEECRIINLVRLHMQVVWESDVFSADGQKIDPTYLRRRQPGEKWSSYLFPRHKVLPYQFNLWLEALEQLAPGGRRPRRMGKIAHEGHKIWNWRLNEETGYLLNQAGPHVEVYQISNPSGRRSRNEKYEYVETVEHSKAEGKICTVAIDESEQVAIQSITSPAQPTDLPETFLEVLKEWGHTWMWENLQITGGLGKGVNMRTSTEIDWVFAAIERGSMMAVSDGSYIRQLHPDLCSTAMIMECQHSGKRLVVSFAEQSQQANAYRGELLGLMAIHLLLLSFNRVKPDLQGEVHIYSDCLGALDKVENLPPRRIPSRCKHSDVLKNIMVNCENLTFKRLFSHVKAHQDDTDAWNTLTRQSQLNCGCDEAAKGKVNEADPDDLPPQKQFPLEPLALFIEGSKVTTESGPSIRYAAHRQEAKELFHQQNILTPDAFEEVSWKHVHPALHDVPKMFQIFACKQVFGVSANFHFLHKRDESVSPMCPSCKVCRERAEHILLCGEEGRVSALKKFSTQLAQWMVAIGVERDLIFLMVKFIQERGGISMEEICRLHNLPDYFLPFARSQDVIGWRRFLEGMISGKIISAIREGRSDLKIDEDKFTQQLVIKLLEITHGLWIYRNMVVHDEMNGLYAVEGRERLQQAIEEQLALGGEDLCEEDKWMMEINLNDLDVSTGDREAYWVLAIQMARERFYLRQRRNEAAERSVHAHGEG